MISISQDQALDRWGTLPDILREAIVSDTNSDFIWKTCNDEYIPEEKINEVAKVIGYTLLGFLHPEDVAQELKDRLSLNPKIAGPVADAINKRIFTPLRVDLDRIYSPINNSETTPIESGQKKFEDIGFSPKTKVVQNDTVPSPKPSILSDIGWSKQPTPSPYTDTIVPVPSSISTSPPTASKPTTFTEPAPMMLHEDTTFKPAEKNTGFTLPRPGGAAEMTMNRGVGQAPARPAVLEFGGIKKPTPQPPAPAPSSMRPTGFGPSLASSAPTANMGSRNVSQVMPVTAKPNPTPLTPPKPPTPSMASAASSQIPRPPKPPAPPTTQISQPNKPIVKDFL